MAEVIINRKKLKKTQKEGKIHRLLWIIIRILWAILLYYGAILFQQINLEPHVTRKLASCKSENIYD